jgi:hypothetical protein
MIPARPATLVILSALLALAIPETARAAPPVCTGGFVTTAPGERITFPPDPCPDPEGDPYTLEVVTAPAHGTLTMDATGTHYDPMPGYHGPDEFTYRATDSNMEQSAEATVSILIDSAPTCGDSSASVETGKLLILPDPPCSDADGDDIFLWLYDPLYGTLTISPDGLTATYISRPGYVGRDMIFYEAEDDFGLFSFPGVLTITVTASPPRPVRPTPPPSSTPKLPADSAAPRFRFDRPRGKLRAVLRKGLRLALTSNEAGRVSVKLSVNRATARKLKLKRRTVGTLTSTTQAGRTTLVVRFTSKARKALRKATRVKLLVTVRITDASGNRSTRTMNVTLKR